jgi:hypothetical protein
MDSISWKTKELKGFSFRWKFSIRAAKLSSKPTINPKEFSK